VPGGWGLWCQASPAVEPPRAADTAGAVPGLGAIHGAQGAADAGRSAAKS